MLDNDSEFLRYYIEMDKKGELRPKHETKIMVLEDEQGVGDLFLHKLFPEHLQIYYEEYGGLKVLFNGSESKKSPQTATTSNLS